MLDARHNARFFHITSFDLPNNLRDRYHYTHFNNKKQGSEHCTFPETVLFISIDSYSQVMLSVDSKVCAIFTKACLLRQLLWEWEQPVFFFFFNFEELQHRHSGQHKTKWDPGFATENSQQMEKPQLRVYESLLGIKAKLLNVG